MATKETQSLCRTTIQDKDLYTCLTKSHSLSYYSTYKSTNRLSNHLISSYSILLAFDL